MNIQAVFDKLTPFMLGLGTALPGRRFAIAGGAVRDLLMDRPVKDIDVLIEAKEPLSPAEVTGVQEVLKVVFKLHEDMDDLDNLAGYKDTDRVEFPNGIYVGDGADLILVDDVQAYVKDFPDDISMAYLEREAGLVITREFYTAHEDKDITYRDSAGGERLGRLLDKYDYTVTHRKNPNAQ